VETIPLLGEVLEHVPHGTLDQVLLGFRILRVYSDPSMPLEPRLIEEKSGLLDKALRRR
jgi:hypothetical protein